MHRWIQGWSAICRKNTSNDFLPCLSHCSQLLTPPLFISSHLSDFLSSLFLLPYQVFLCRRQHLLLLSLYCLRCRCLCQKHISLINPRTPQDSFPCAVGSKSSLIHLLVQNTSFGLGCVGFFWFSFFFRKVISLLFSSLPIKMAIFYQHSWLGKMTHT